jgi:Tol biopolymer transport system component
MIGRSLRVSLSATLVAVALLASGCEDGESEDATVSTPEATAAVAASPEVTPTAESLPNLRWLPAELPVFAGDEVAEPFSTPERGHTEWQVLRVTGNAAPELLLRTTRSVSNLEWSPDGRSVTARLRSKAAGAGPPDLLGVATFDFAGPAPAVSQVLFDRSLSVDRAPDGSRMAVNGTVGGPMMPPAVFVAERNGPVVKLEGFPLGAGFGGWAPSGDALLVHEFVIGSQGRFGGRVFLMPLSGPPTLVNPRPIGKAPEGAWSPDGTRLAFLDTGYPPEAQADLYLFDRRTGQRRLVATGRAPNTPPRWTEAGDGLLVGDELIDPATGAASRPPSLALAGGALWRAVSPDGRLMVVADTSDPFDPTGCGRTGMQTRNRLFLVDLGSGVRRLLRDCDAAIAWPEWLDDRHVTMVQWGPGYEGMASRVLLLDVTTGALRPVTPDLEHSSAAVHAPDRARFLVTGQRLRLFDASGTLLRTIEPPPGLEIVEAAWSPDWSGFVYIARTVGVSPYE